MTTDVPAVSSAGRAALPWQATAVRRRLWFAAGFAAGIALTLSFLSVLARLQDPDARVGRVDRRPSLSISGPTSSIAAYAGFGYAPVQAHTPDIEWEPYTRPARWPRQ
jgi:hypothetical protein